MKSITLLLFAAAFLGAAIPVQTARADISVGIDYFYDALQPYGDWNYVDGYGYCWSPELAMNDPEWYPYSDGYWAYTSAGWTWISNEDFGWATYHYGRWMRIHGRWHWVPGYEWAPAWVSWRETDSHIGWAPLPPEARWLLRIGLGAWIDSYYDIGPRYYNFVPHRHFVRRGSLRGYIVDRRHNVTYIDRSVNITNITYQQNVVNNIFVGGPDVTRVERLGGGSVRRLELRRDTESFQSALQGAPDARTRLSRIEGDQLVVASPTVRRDEAPRLPARVRERIERPEIDRGWRGLDNPELAEKVHQKHRDEFAKMKPAELPDKQAEIVTSTVPPPAVGRLLKPQERMGALKRPDPKLVDEEVRKATSEPPAMKPGEVAPQPGVVETPPTKPGADRRSETVRPGLEPDRRPKGVAEQIVPRPRLMPPGRTTPADDEARKTMPPGKGSAATKTDDSPPAVEVKPDSKAPDRPKVESLEPGGRPRLPDRPGVPELRPIPTPRPSLPEGRSIPKAVRPTLPEERPAPKALRPLPEERPAPKALRPLPEERPAPKALRPLPEERPVPKAVRPLPEERPAPKALRPTLPQERPAPKAERPVPEDERSARKKVERPSLSAAPSAKVTRPKLPEDRVPAKVARTAPPAVRAAPAPRTLPPKVARPSAPPKPAVRPPAPKPPTPAKKTPTAEELRKKRASKG